VSTTTGLPVAAFCSLHPLARVRVCSRLSSTELRRQLRDFELDAAIAHFDLADHEGLEVTPLYEERYVLLVSGDQLAKSVREITWAEAARLPLALLSPDMRFRQFIDNAFRSSGVTASPQVETDSVASLYAHVATGAWASVVPHTWLRAIPVTGTIGTGQTRAIPLVKPDAAAQISVAIRAGNPASAAARSFLNVAANLLLDEVFDRETVPA
jgi:DNA-binding transcriptional LysR family regulator